MSKFIVLYNFNKYYNRKIYRLNSFEDYQALITDPGDGINEAPYDGFILENTNFDITDGVFAKHVINIRKTDPTFFKMEQPDYLVMEEEYKTQITLPGGRLGYLTTKKLSRWFVLEAVRLRRGQYELSLRRDLLADYYNEVLSAPVFIEKGNPLVSDPAIFNKEPFTFNQIKKNELLLNFNKLSGKGKGWIVGYLAKEETPSAIGPCVGRAKLPADILDYDSDLPAGLKTALSNGSGYMYNGKFALENYVRFNTGEVVIPPGVQRLFTKIWLYDFGNTVSWGIPSNAYENIYTGYVHFDNNWSRYTIAEYMKNKYLTWRSLSWKNDIKNWYDSLNVQNQVSDDFSSFNNKVCYRNGKYYLIGVNKIPDGRTQSISFKCNQITIQGNALAVGIHNFYNTSLYNSNDNIGVNSDLEPNEKTAAIYAFEDVYSFSMTEVSYDDVKATIPATRNPNLDAPYDLFCIPVGEVSVKSSGSTVLTTAGNIALAIAQGISVKAASKCYDIQLLPYCPFAEILNSDGDIDITGFYSGSDYSYITKEVSGSDVNVGIIIYPKTCRGTFDMTIPSTSEVYNDCLPELESAIEKKIKYETRLCRFVSPNFASTFDINVQKNNGIVNLNVDYYYKPYSPYIHVAPYFDYMYGFDFNDPKGLICSGDYSIATASSKWEEYQIQNKNYELIFNRQIQNLDVNNAIAMEQLKVTGAIGTATSGLTGAAAGAIAGSIIPGVGTLIGAGVGAIAGAVSSGVGAKYDVEYLKRSQTEARGFQMDMYSYNLGNIQALPYSLTRVSSFTENNKIFPFIEFYECTDEEKEALRNKIKYNGMTIMRIGRIAEFIQDNYRYVQGKLIRLEGINEDSHVIAEIANEVKEGAYYYGSNTSES